MNEAEINVEGSGVQETGAGEPEEGWQPRDALLGVLAFLLIAAIAVGGYFYYQSSKPPPLNEGDPAPDFNLPLLGGEPVSLSDYRGKVVLLNVWATWCGPCREEMPSMQRLYQSLKGQPFEILAVSIDTRGAVDVEPFIKRLALSFPILLDTEKEVPSLYQTTAVPESFIIAPDGTIAKRIIGPLDWSNSQTPEFQLIKKLLQGP